MARKVPEEWPLTEDSGSRKKYFPVGYLFNLFLSSSL